LDTNKEELEEFLASLEDYSPIISDEVVSYYLSRTGFVCPDNKVKRLISLAAQKFISDVANDALQYCKIRQQANKSKKGKEVNTDYGRFGSESARIWHQCKETRVFC